MLTPDDQRISDAGEGDPSAIQLTKRIWVSFDVYVTTTCGGNRGRAVQILREEGMTALAALFDDGPAPEPGRAEFAEVSRHLRSILAATSCQNASERATAQRIEGAAAALDQVSI